MNIDITPIIQAVIALIAAIITAKVIPWIKAKTTNEQQQYIAATIKTLVFAAEQLYGAGMGEAKYNHVATKLAEMGIKVDRDQIEAAIKEHLAELHLVRVKEPIPETDAE